MAIAVSIVFSLVAGVTVMFENKYFWGKEDNPNICAMNTSLTSATATVGSIVPLVVVVLAFLGAVMLLCTTRGF